MTEGKPSWSTTPLIFLLKSDEYKIMNNMENLKVGAII